MQSEKMRILKMLENGQITAAEAAQLLQAMNPSESVPPIAPPPVPQHTPPPPIPPDSPRDGYSDSYASNGRPGTSDLGRKFESFTRGIAPKVERFTEIVADKLMGAADSVSGVLGVKSPQGQSHTGTRKSIPSGAIEKNIEMLMNADGYNELNLSGLNGDVRLKGYNGDKLTARIVYRAKHTGAGIDFVKLGGKYFLNYEPDDFSLVSIDIFVPERAFSIVKVDGINCHLDCSSLSASEMHFSNVNGTARLAGLAAGNLTAESGGGRFIASGIAALSATIENLNGTMDVDELDIANLKLANFNGPLSLMMSQFARHSDYIWAVETGNAKLSMHLPTSPDLGYHIKAHATMGQIRLGLTGLQFLTNEPSFVEAHSPNFETATKKIKLAVETSNASLVIN